MSTRRLPHQTKSYGMQLQAILNRIQEQPGAVFVGAQFVEHSDGVRIRVTVRERRENRCVPAAARNVRSVLGNESVRLWVITVFFRYAPRLRLPALRREGLIASVG